MSRTRTMGPETITGSYQLGSSGSPVFRTQERFAKTCIDFLGYGVDHPLDIVETRVEGDATASGSNGVDGSGYRKLTQLPLRLVYPSYGSFPDMPSDSEAVTLAMSRTNPGRSEVQLPVFIFELRELPRLAYLKGKSILQKAASGNLSWQFGMRPLLSDLAKMIQFADSVNKRCQELTRLQSASGLKRRVTLYSDSKVVIKSTTTTLESVPCVISAKEHVTYTVKVWASIRWRPSPTYSFPMDRASQQRKARQSLLSLRSGQITQNLWEAVPWSWLIDYFSNVGDFLVAIDNQVAHVAGKVNVMTTKTSRREYVVTSKPNWVELSPSTPAATKTQKLRTVNSPIPGISIRLPMLSLRQLSILGSLSILRR